MRDDLYITGTLKDVQVNIGHILNDLESMKRNPAYDSRIATIIGYMNRCAVLIDDDVARLRRHFDGSDENAGIKTAFDMLERRVGKIEEELNYCRKMITVDGSGNIHIAAPEGSTVHFDKMTMRCGV